MRFYFIHLRCFLGATRLSVRFFYTHVCFWALFVAESGFSSFLAPPLKDGWRHVGNHEYANAPNAPQLKSAAPGGDQAHQHHNAPTRSIYPSFSRACGHKMPERGCACCRAEMEAEKQQHRTYENMLGSSSPGGGGGGGGMQHMMDDRLNGGGGGGSGLGARSFKSYTPKRPVRTVHFSQDGMPGGGREGGREGGGGFSPDGRQTLPAKSSSSSAMQRQPRFQPQSLQHFQPRALRGSTNSPAQPANAVSQYVDAARSPQRDNHAAQRHYAGDLAFYGTGRGGRGELPGDSLNDSVDTGDDCNTTTTSGSYTIDSVDPLEDTLQDLQSDIFV